jgi:hypothetical protein
MKVLGCWAEIIEPVCHLALLDACRDPVQRLDIELPFAFEVDEPHRRARRRFRYALYIPVIIA